jgi:TPR repeat protein
MPDSSKSDGKEMIIALLIPILVAIPFPRFIQALLALPLILVLSGVGQMAHAECVQERIIPRHVDFGWIRGQPDLNGKPLWKLGPGSIVTYCGYSARDNRNPPIEWHWVSFESVQEPWNHEGWISSHILERVVADREMTNEPSRVPLATRAGPTPKSREAERALNDAATAEALKKAEAAMGRDNGTAYRILQGLANQGNPEAEVLLGQMLSGGYHDIPQDYATAMNLFRRAASKDAIAGIEIAGMYQDGKGVPKDYAKAAELYLKFANRGDWREPETGPLAQISLGQIYEKGGYGLPQDYVQAYKWYDIAAAHRPSDVCPPPPQNLVCPAAVNRDWLAVKMTKAQINEAKRLVPRIIDPRNGV